jgi:hypothetical protein
MKKSMWGWLGIAGACAACCAIPLMLPLLVALAGGAAGMAAGSWLGPEAARWALVASAVVLVGGLVWAYRIKAARAKACATSCAVGDAQDQSCGCAGAS